MVEVLIFVFKKYLYPKDVTEFSDPSTGFGVTQPNSPLHGSTPKLKLLRKQEVI